MGNPKQAFLTVAGGAVGFAIGGPTGAMYGAQLGYSIGASTLNTQLPTNKGPQLEDLQQQVSGYGIPLGKSWGTVRRAGVVIWAPDIEESQHVETVDQGGKGAPKVSQEYETYTYAASFAVAFNDGEISGVRRVWANDKLIFDEGGIDDYGSLTVDETTDWIGTKLQGLGDGAGSLSIYNGTETQDPDPTIQSYEGVDDTPGFRGTAYLVFEDLQLVEFGNRRPQILVEFVRVGADISTGGSIVKDVPFSSIAGSGAYSGMSTIDSDGTCHYLSRGLGGTKGKYYKIFPTGSFSYQGEINVGTGLSRRGVSSELPMWCAVHGGTDVDIAIIWSGGDLITGNEFTFSLPGTGLSTFLSNTAMSVNHIGNNTKGKFAIATTKADGDFRIMDYEKYVDISPGLAGISLDTDIEFTNIVDFTTAVTSKSNWVLSESYLYVFDSTGFLYQYDHVGTLLDNWTLTETISASSTAASCVDSDDERIVYWADVTNLKSLDTRTGVITDYGNITNNVSSVGILIIRVKSGILITEDYGSVQYVTLGNLSKTSETLDTVITELCTDSGLSASDIDVTLLSAIEVDGFNKTDGAASKSLESLFVAYNVSAYEDNGKIIFNLRNGDVDSTLTEADLGCGVGGSLSTVIPYSRVDNSSLPRSVIITYMDYDNGYAIGSQSAQKLRELVDTEQQITVQLPMVLTATEARQIAERVLDNLWASRVDYEKISLPLKYLDVVPTDILSVVVQGVPHEIRVTAVTISDTVEIIGISNSRSAQVSTISGETPVLSYQGSGYGGATEAYYLDLPPLRNQDSDIGHYIAAHGYYPGWRGALFYAESDNGGWSNVGSVNLPITAGVATDSLGTGISTTIDYESTVNVRLRSGTLSSSTKAAVLSDPTANAIALGGAGRWEILQFITATEETDGSFTLSGLLRGLIGTEFSMSGHAVNDIAIVLDPARLLRVPTGDINVQSRYKSVTFNNTFQSGSDSLFTNSGASIAPLAPVHLSATDNGDGTFDLEWVRRGRVFNKWADFRDVPLGETTQSYTVQVYQNDGTTLVSTSASSIQSLTVTANSGYKIQVAQDGDYYGVGQFSTQLEV